MLLNLSDIIEFENKHIKFNMLSLTVYIVNKWENDIVKESEFLLLTEEEATIITESSSILLQRSSLLFR